MTIKQYLESLGATQSELGAKVVKLMEQNMLIDADLESFRPDTVLEFLVQATKGIEKANAAAQYINNDARVHEEKLQGAIAKADEELADLREQTLFLQDSKINDPTVKDAVMAFVTTLKSVQDIFGPSAMSSDVIVAAINAGSYIGWRSIMGPKNEDEKRPRPLR